jgi:hypothetical protein
LEQRGARLGIARERAWQSADRNAPDAGRAETVGLDGVLVIAQDASPTWKRTNGQHRLMGFVYHGPGGTGEPVAALLRPGNSLRLRHENGPPTPPADVTKLRG